MIFILNDFAVNKGNEMLRSSFTPKRPSKNILISLKNRYFIPKMSLKFNLLMNPIDLGQF
jgi:hypothetical protein